MEAIYTWVSIGLGKKSVVEIMGAPITDQAVFLAEIEEKLKQGTLLCVSGELKKSGEGTPASNFRFEKNLEINKNVVGNYLQLFDHYKKLNDCKPILITIIPRNWRKYSWFIREDGVMIRKDQDFRRRADDPADPIYLTGFVGGREDAYDREDDVLMRFLSANCIEQDQMVKIRESCKGARYHTYLADMLSFLYELRFNEQEFSTFFSPEYRTVAVENDGTKDILYFNESMESGHVFMCPKRDSTIRIYNDFYKAVSLDENETKAKIRKHLLENRIERWTDFSANDTDDAFTMLMLIHAFNGIVGVKRSHGCAEGVYYKPTEEEKLILDNLQSSIEPWRAQLE